MKQRRMFLAFTLFVLVLTGVERGLQNPHAGVSAQTDATPLPEVETAVAATLTAVAPTFESMPPTRTARPSPTPTVTLTPSSTPTPTPTFTASATLSEVEKIAGETLTAIFIDQSILQVWVQYDDGRKHPWHRELPDDLGAASRESAELVVIIDEERRLEDTAQYLGCGTVEGYLIVYVARLVDPRDNEQLSTKNFAGSHPTFPSTIRSCRARVGKPPDFTRQFVDWIAPYAYLLGTPTPTPKLTPTPRPTRTPRPPSRTPGPTPPPDADFRPQTRYVTASTNLPLRTCPQVTCDRVGRLNPGDSFFAEGQFTDENGRVWYSLTYEGQTVWVAGWLTGAEPPTD